MEILSLRPKLTGASLKRLRENLNLPPHSGIKSNKQAEILPYKATVAFGATALGATNADLAIKQLRYSPALPSPFESVVCRDMRDSNSRVKTMKRPNPHSMSVEEFWALRSEINSILASRIAAEKAKLEKRLRQLQSNGTSSEGRQRERRPYPQVLPKYRNPAKPGETWAGRGKQPRWVTELRPGRSSMTSGFSRRLVARGDRAADTK